MLKILVVDDEKDIEYLFRQKFRKEIRNNELCFHFAFSGEEALEYMRSLDPFDVVLVMSDINMPGISGLELLRQTKKMFPLLKVIMITAYGDEKNHSTSLDLGANGFLIKPVDFNLLKEKICELETS